MSEGLGFLPSFAQGGIGAMPDLSPDLLSYLQGPGQGSAALDPANLPPTQWAAFGAAPPQPAFSPLNAPLPSPARTPSPAPTPNPGQPSVTLPPQSVALDTRTIPPLPPASGPAPGAGSAAPLPYAVASGGGVPPLAPPAAPLADRIMGVESGGNNAARNPNSSAMGAGQFIDSTWLGMIGRYRPDLASLPRDQILALRSDPQLSREMVQHYADENGAALRSAGLPDTDGNRYLGHFLGAGGMRSVLSADPSTPVSQVLGAGQIGANPFLRGMTAGQVADWAARKMSGTAPGAGTTPGVAPPRGASMGSTAQVGGFGLGGIVGQGGPVAGQASPVPGLASLSDQPMTAGPAPGGFSTDPAGGAPQPPASPYGAIGQLLRGIQAQQRGQRGQGSGSGSSMGSPGGAPSPISLHQARSMFDPSRFFEMLRAHGVNQPAR